VLKDLAMAFGGVNVESDDNYIAFEAPERSSRRTSRTAATRLSILACLGTEEADFVEGVVTRQPAATGPTRGAVGRVPRAE